MRDLGRVFTHIHDQEIEVSEYFYLDLLTLTLPQFLNARNRAAHNAMFF